MVLDLLSRIIALFRLNNAPLNNRIALLLNITSVFFVIAALIYFIATHLFQIKNIVIEGNISHVSDLELKNIANNQLHGTMFTLNINELQEKFEGLTWIKHVSVKKEFPSTLVVKLQEHIPVAVIPNLGLLSSDGEIFDAVISDENIPALLTKFNSPQEAYNMYLQIEPVIAKYGDSVTKINIDSPKVIHVVTKNKLQIIFCEQNLSDSINKMDEYWSKLHDISPKINSMNFCYKDAVAIN